jgi:hypothetical protein
MTWQPLRERMVRMADVIARGVHSIVGQRVRQRLVSTAPEFIALQAALQASDRQLRELGRQLRESGRQLRESDRQLRESDRQLRESAPLRDLGFYDFLRDRRPDNLHTNGCGDFQLMARQHWEELRGYPELETFSMNIDGLFSYIAHAAGIAEQILDMPIYHLEHEIGSGWSPEGEARLRKRIAESGITWLDARTVYIWAAYMRWLGRPMLFNGSNWGMADSHLPEVAHSACAWRIADS